MYIDIAVGLILGGLVSFVTGEPSFSLMLFGVLATLAPDLDFIVWLVRNKWQINEYAHEHRDLLHLPLVFGVFGGIVIGFIHPSFGWLWFLGTMAHFIHDTFDGGFGIKWLHPLYHGYFTLASYSPKRHFRTLEEQRAAAAIHGNPNWLEEQYFRINPKLLFEYALLGIVLLGLLLWYWYFS